jgi:hypothetical protein
LFDGFLILSRRFERKLGINPTDEYLFRLSNSIKEVKELQHYYDEEQYNENYKINL